MENWRFIEANSDYMVSDHGRILSFKGKSKLIISSSITAKGYEYVAIRQKGIYVGYSVHRLVATAFIPNPKRLPQVNHLDGNKLNNHVANLEWCDAYDNVMHAIRTGLRPSSPALSPVPCATTDEAGNILQAYPSMNALVKGEQMNPKQRNWLVLHLLHPERLKQSAMKKKPRAERSGSEECFLIAPEIPVLTVKADSIGEFEAGNLLGTGRSSNSVGESEAGNLLGTGRSSNSVGKSEAGNLLGTGRSSNSVGESEAGNLLGTGRSSNSVGESEAGNLLGTGRSSNSIGKSEAGNVCVQSVSSPCFIASSSYFSLCSCTPFNDATLLPPPVSRRIRHFWFQHLYIAQRKRTKKGVSAMKDTIIIHCSATRAGQDITAADIDCWHRARGFWSIGYHYVIRLDGTIEPGRDVTLDGAHCMGWNQRSIGICYVGGLDKEGRPADTRTDAQRTALIRLVKSLQLAFPNVKQVIGHRDTSPDLNGDGIISPNEYMKACPCFDVKKEF